MIDKALSNPLGMAAQPELLVDIEVPEQSSPPNVVVNPDGSVDVIIYPTVSQEEDYFYANLAESMSDSDLNTLANDLLAAVDEDRRSRQDWVDTYLEGIKLLGLKYEERTDPFPNASGVFNPMLAEAAVTIPLRNDAGDHARIRPSQNSGAW